MHKKLNDITLKPGRYVLAVSGGVDSMVLLDLLHRQPDLELIVAHFNHGIRVDAGKDERLVRSVAKQLGLKFRVGRGNLGATASEEKAREARYKFLNSVKDGCKAKSIVTAHHQDDSVETAIINLIRGSGRLGLSAMQNNQRILRPLLNIPKADILDYAKDHRLIWREDNSNRDTIYLRNYIRANITSKLSKNDKQELLINIEKVAKNNTELNSLIATLSRTIERDNVIDRSKYLAVPQPLDSELLAHWLRQNKAEVSQKTVERLNVGLKTAQPGVKLDVSRHLELIIGVDSAHFSNR